jgi:hypothetical protein
LEKGSLFVVFDLGILQLIELHHYLMFELLLKVDTLVLALIVVVLLIQLVLELVVEYLMNLT